MTVIQKIYSFNPTGLRRLYTIDVHIRIHMHKYNNDKNNNNVCFLITMTASKQCCLGPASMAD